MVVDRNSLLLASSATTMYYLYTQTIVPRRTPARRCKYMVRPTPKVLTCTWAFRHNADPSPRCTLCGDKFSTQIVVGCRVPFKGASNALNKLRLLGTAGLDSQESLKRKSRLLASVSMMGCVRQVVRPRFAGAYLTI